MPKINQSSCTLFGIAMLVLLRSANADQILMTNGDQLSGTIVRKSGELLLLKNTYAGEVRLRWTDIDSLATDGPISLMLDDEVIVNARVILSTSKQATLRSTDNSPEQTIALSRIRFINPPREESGIGSRVLGHANVALSQTRGNSESESSHGDGEFILRGKPYRFTLGGEANYGREGEIVSTSNWRAYTSYDYFFKKKQFFYTNGSMEKDQFKDIQRRSVIGAGYGYQLVENETSSVSLRGGPNFVKTKRIDGPDDSYVALGWGVDARHRLDLASLELFHVQDGTRELAQGGNTILHTRTGLRLPVADRLNATAQIDLDWESNPAIGRKRTDTTLLLGLGYELR